MGHGGLAFFPLAVVLLPTGVGERSSGQSHVTPVFTTQAETLATAHIFVFWQLPTPKVKHFIMPIENFPTLKTMPFFFSLFFFLSQNAL